MVLDEETQARLKAKRESLEAGVKALDGKRLWFQERYLQFPGIAHITTDDWGARVSFESEHWPEPLNLSGRWDVLIVGSDHLGAQYCGWSLDSECPYPELGINSDHQI